MSKVYFCIIALAFLSMFTGYSHFCVRQQPEITKPFRVIHSRKLCFPILIVALQISMIIKGLKDLNEKPITKSFTVVRAESESNLSPMEATLATDLVTGKNFQPGEQVASEDEGKWPLAIWFAIIAGLLFLSEAFLSHRLARRRIDSSGRIELKPVY